MATSLLESPSPRLAVLRWGVVMFPGSNCDLDTVHVLAGVLGQDAQIVWHEETQLSGFDALVLPGGFAHGDYLRAGAVARFSPVMDAAREFAESGKPVLGICNGFQVLLEAGFLPGAMRRNNSQNFICDWTYLRVENASSPFLNQYTTGEILRIPVAHGEGNYFAEPDVLAEMERNGQVLLRYCTATGELADEANPNGSVGSVAGISNARGNVMGLMPHPERASERILGSHDGARLFESVINSFS